MLEKIFRQLEMINPSAPGPQPAGRAGRNAGGASLAVLRRKLSTATGLLEAEEKVRRIKGYQKILLLKERLNPSRIRQKEVLTAEVA